MSIKLYNTKVRKKVPFAPIDDKNLRMYVCGPTVYDRAHLGNARPVIVFDTLFRLLRHVYGADHVTYVRNFTDVDDKINATALARKEAGAAGSLEDLINERSDETIAWYREDMAAVGAMEPTHAPRATQYIAQMVAMIETLEEKGFAYAAPSKIGHNSGQRYVWMNADVVQAHSFFSVDEFEDYGDLSGRSVDEMIAGARAETGDGKKNPMDFVLWKPSTEDQPGWDSPWGRGRPGWHIECSAMAKSLLGDIFDIHGGGLDLQFPHHENEIAQSCCANGTDRMANVWMHNEMLQVEGKKMSKSLGNFFTVRDLLDQGVPGEVIRFVMLSTHYRKPMDWTEKKAREARTELEDWAYLTEDTTESSTVPIGIIEALSDDLNTYGAITELRRLSKEGDFAGLLAGINFLGLQLPEVDPVLQLPEVDPVQAEILAWLAEGIEYRGAIEAAVNALVTAENALRTARANKDYAKADRLRDGLKRAGLSVAYDADGGVTFKREDHFDPSKLEDLL